ncbi:hypothetical protein HYC85_001796 [Camellia sinensis]|uniref:Cytochrome P450 n=1 Tax=Camellia sinensis TaxID=4442 RepID=A0A7J7I7M9_CAMSI|nr:hypothetical protein HYC85_001796 [Camellia sinensis]
MASLGYYEVLLSLTCFLFLFFLSTTIDVVLPRNWPLFGMLPILLCHVHQIHDWATRVLCQAGGTFLFKGPFLANTNMLVSVDPSNVHYIMSSSFLNFPKDPKFMEKPKKTCSITTQSPPFLAKTTQDKVEKGLIKVLEHVSKQVVDLQALFQRLTFDTTCILVTGYDPGCLSIDLPHVPFSKAMDDAEEAIFIRHIVPERVWKFQRWVEIIVLNRGISYVPGLGRYGREIHSHRYTGEYLTRHSNFLVRTGQYGTYRLIFRTLVGIGHEKKLTNARETLDHIIAKYISMKRDELSREIKSNDEEEGGVDLLTSYLHQEEIEKTRLAEFSHGFFWLVSTHLDVEEKIREELKSNIPTKEANKWRLFSVEEVSKLVYLHSALCESLRLYPPVPFQHRASYARYTSKWASC